MLHPQSMATLLCTCSLLCAPAAIAQEAPATDAPAEPPAAPTAAPAEPPAPAGDGASTDDAGAATPEAPAVEGAPAAVAAPDAKEQLFVLSVAGTPEHVSIVNTVVNAHVRDLSDLDSVVIMSEAKERLVDAYKKINQGLCDESCIADAVHHLGATEVLGGTARAIGDKVQVSLLRMRRDGVVSQQEALVASHPEMLKNATAGLLSKLFSKPLPDLQGAVMLQAEGDASIVVDGEDQGVTPQVLLLAPGPHAVVMRAPGKVEWKRDIVVEPGTPQVVAAVFDENPITLWPVSAVLAAASAGALVAAVSAGVMAELIYDGEVLGIPVSPDKSYDLLSPAGSEDLAAREQQITVFSIAANTLYISAGVFALAAVGTTVADVVLTE